MFETKIVAALPPPSRFAELRRWPARAVLMLVAMLIAVAFIQPSAEVPKNTGTSADRADVMLYDRIVDEVRRGGNYYGVAANAQREGAYPLKPFVTMRPPTLAVFQASLPNRLGVVIAFALLFLGTVAAWAWRLRTERTLLGTLLVTAGAATLALPDLLMWHEAWAALLIALSLALRTPTRFGWSIGFGLLAALIREISIAYILVMATTALLSRRRIEASAWAAALLAVSIFLTWHATQVAAVVRPDDLASPGWAAVGGWRFAVSMFWLTGPFRLLPFVVSAVLVPLSLLGWTGWRSETGLRGALLLTGYAVGFAIFGRPDNFYWAFLLAPLVPLGLLFAPAALTDLAKAAR